MAVRQRRYPKDELAERGQKLYESGIRQQVEAGNEGKIVPNLGSFVSDIALFIISGHGV